MRYLEQPNKPQHPQPAQINLSQKQWQDRRQDGNQINQAGKAENIIQPPAGGGLEAACLIVGNGPDPQQIFDPEDGH